MSLGAKCGLHFLTYFLGDSLMDLLTCGVIFALRCLPDRAITVAVLLSDLNTRIAGVFPSMVGAAARCDAVLLERTLRPAISIRHHQAELGSNFVRLIENIIQSDYPHHAT